MSLDGFCSIDLQHKRVWGNVHGLTVQRHIRPLLEALDFPVSFEYFDKFTQVPCPVPASCSWDVDYSQPSLDLRLDLRPTLGLYNGVPLVQASSLLGVAYTNGNYVVSVGPLLAVNADARRFKGSLAVRGNNDRCDLELDAASNLPFQHTLDIIGYLNDGLLDDIVCLTPPYVTGRGMIATDLKNQSDNDVTGHIDCERGTLLKVPLQDASLDYHYIGDAFVFTNVCAKGDAGGVFRGDGKFRFPQFDPDQTTFAFRLKCNDAQLEQLSTIVGFDPEGRTGRFDGEIELSGSVATNLFKRSLCGFGSIRVTDGHLAQMRVFAGLTSLLADKVPGVASIVNQHQASADFKIANGVLSTENCFLEGNLFSIKITGCYDIAADNLDFVLRVQFLKKDSILGMLVHPVVWPFSKLLMEFRVQGSIRDPQWKYINIIDRVL